MSKRSFNVGIAILHLCGSIIISNGGYAQSSLTTTLVTNPSTTKIRTTEYLRAMVSTAGDPGPFTYRWFYAVGSDTTWNPDTTPSLWAINSARLPIFIPGSTLHLGVRTTSSWTGASAFSTASFAVNTPPSGGYVTVTPSIGQALSTIFLVTASGWTDDDGTAGLKYRFGYYNGSGSKIPLNTLGSANFWQGTLPLGPLSGSKLDVFAEVYDISTEYSEATQRITASMDGLPVELQNFSIETRNGTLRLSWQTATESDNFGFDVEQKCPVTGGWQKIGFVEGHGTSNAPHSYHFTCSAVPAGSSSYRLKQIDNSGAFGYSDALNIFCQPQATLTLDQNHPNPFNPTTTFSFSLASASFVTLKVVDLMGREAATIIAKELPAGAYAHQWNASGLPSGIYFYRLQAGAVTQTKRLLLLK